MPKSKKRRNRKRRKPGAIPAVLIAKAERDKANSYIKAAGRMGDRKAVNPVAKAMAVHIGLQTGTPVKVRDDKRQGRDN